jgi:hypothetical protein
MKSLLPLLLQKKVLKDQRLETLIVLMSPTFLLRITRTAIQTVEESELQGCGILLVVGLVFH